MDVRGHQGKIVKLGTGVDAFLTTLVTFWAPKK